MNTQPAIGPTASPAAFVVKLDARPDFTAVERMPRGPERKRAAWDALSQTAQQSQAPLVALAERLKADGMVTDVQVMPSPNALVVTPAYGKGTSVLNAFRTGGVSSIYSNEGALLWQAGRAVQPRPIDGKPTWGLDVVNKPVQPLAPPVTTPYGVDLVGAPSAWAQGAAGAGLVFGSIDTGVDHTHEALRDNYRGTGADGSLQHDYNWFDMSPTPAQAPKDVNGHGTHTTGSAVGKGIGVAPEAKWIGVNGLAGTADAALKALLWMQAPTRLDGTAPDPSLAPDVVGMSWWMGSSSQDLFRESILNLRAAGIEPVKSAGNQGPAGRTITSPGQYPELYAVAAVDSKGGVAKFSSRGPAPYPSGSTTPKPDFAAPGVDIISSTPGGRYGKMSGTSMAQPHMSGVLLDILSKYPQLTHDQLTAALTAGARDGGAPGFDAEYGAGLVHLPGALKAAERLAQGLKPGRATAPVTRLPGAGIVAA
jgi:Subtilase family